MNKTDGQIAYEAYCAHTGWKSLVSGAQLPAWGQVKPEIQAAWEAAAWQVLRRPCNENEMLREANAALVAKEQQVRNELNRLRKARCDIT